MNLTIDCGDLWGLAAATTASVESGLLLTLAKQDFASCEDLASKLELDPNACARVLDVLVATGLLECREAGYGLSPESLAVHRAFPTGLAMALGIFSGTLNYLRTGKSLAAMDGDLEERSASYRSAVTGLARLFAQAAKGFADALPGRPSSILDVGCGSGIWSLTLADRIPGARVTGLDLPEVLPNFESLAKEKGLSDHIELLPGDMHDIALEPASFDAILLANVIRLESADQASQLIRKLAEGLRPGGQLIVIDALASGTPEREISRAVYRLNLSLRTKNAAVHTPATVRSFLKNAGLQNIHALDFGIYPGAVAALYGTNR